MANPVYNIRDTGRNSARTTDVREVADNLMTSWTSGTTGTIAVTADATYDVSFTQPADTIIRSLIAIPAGNIVTAGASGDDVDFDLGTSAGGGQVIDEKAILDDGGSAVTWVANAPLYIIQNSHGHAANAFVGTGVTAGDFIDLTDSKGPAADGTALTVTRDAANGLGEATIKNTPTDSATITENGDFLPSYKYLINYINTK